MSAPVHCAAATSHGLAFECWHKAWGPYWDQEKQREREQTDAYTAGEWKRKIPRGAIPRPQRHTDLRRVTCLDCWREIAAMARKAVQS